MQYPEQTTTHFSQIMQNMKQIFLLLVLKVFFLLPLAAQTLEDQTAEISGTIVVVNKSGNDVYFINRSDGEVLAKLPAGTEPHEVEISPDGRWAVVGNFGNRENPGNTLSVYDIRRLSLVRTINLGEHIRPHGIKWLAGTQRVIVTSGPTSHLLEVNVRSGKISRAIQMGEEAPHMVASTPDNQKVFASSVRSGNVSVYDLTAGRVTGVFRSGEGAEGIDVSPDGKEVWVTNRGENTIAVFDTRTYRKLASMPSADFPIRGRFTPDGRLFLVSNAQSGIIGVFDTRTREQVAAVKLQPPLPPGEDPGRYFAEFANTSVPIGIVAADNYTAYVANTRADVVSVICLRRFEIIGHFAAGREPDGIGFSPIVPRRSR